MTWWLTSRMATVFVDTDKDHIANDTIITDTAPIFRKFIGQPICNLLGFLKRKGGYRMENIE